MPLVSAIIAVLIGFLLPWRFGIEIEGRTNWLSAGDAAIAITLILSVFLLPRRVFSSFALAARKKTVLPLAIILGVAAYHAALTPAAAGGGRIPALATAWAIIAGVVLSRFDRAMLLAGLRLGAWTSALIALLFLPTRPDIILEHNYFAGLAGAKNTFAFFVAASTLAAAESALSGSAPPRTAWRRRKERFPLVLFEIAAGLTLLTLANARAAAIALVAAFLAMPGLGRRMVFLRGMIVIAATTLAVAASVPDDRVHFAWSILSHADGIPLLGMGPGFGYGLDTVLKMLLELGPLGFAALSSLILTALRRNGLSPWLVLIAVYACAHDLARWPLFWMLLLAAEHRGKGVDRHRE